jgi:hypothetical protein
MSQFHQDRHLPVSSARHGYDHRRLANPLTKAPLVTNLTGSMENVEDER